jgi:replicative DNA helicase
MSGPRLERMSEMFDDWREKVLSGVPPVRYPVADCGALTKFKIGPELITLIGGAPGAGKTAFTMQLVFNALRLDPKVWVVIANVEMPPATLLDRQLSRLSGVSLSLIHERQTGYEHAERIDAGMQALQEVSERVYFIRGGFDLGNIGRKAIEFSKHQGNERGILVLDYVQRISPPADPAGEGRPATADRRGSVDQTMSCLRQFADGGLSVIAVSSVGRQKDNRGRSTYAGETMTLASFKESGELEFGADDAYILAPSSKTPGICDLSHMKARHGDTHSMQLVFRKSTQTFVPVEQEEPERWSSDFNAGGNFP